LFVLAFPIGMCIIAYEAVYVECFGGMRLDSTLVRSAKLIVIYSVVYGYLFLPVGVCLHWIIAKKTESYPSWVWLAIFVSSVMLMFVYFPNGTISGGITLCLLFALPTFRKMGKGIRIFR